MRNNYLTSRVTINTFLEGRGNQVVRVAAISDLHFSKHSKGCFINSWRELNFLADIFLLCGDLTESGQVYEAEILANELKCVNIPVIAILGNHDFHSGYANELSAFLQAQGVVVLDGGNFIYKVKDISIGIGGAKGFCGGFLGARAHIVGEPEMKSFAKLGTVEADKLTASLQSLSTDIRIAIMHYAPIIDTLRGERAELFPFLGDFRLEEPLNRYQPTLAFHGHAHFGSLYGSTSAGVPVYNVAYPLVRTAFRLFYIENSQKLS
ncbi:3',5'-cyclic adenosine monophosphate phosphodiesterase CpdA [Pseudomonas fluorescens]|nr:3',5'-cyclic adenosine monophosphate phosphodiesterase CpdA [Pseudomonas fluorescens]